MKKLNCTDCALRTTLIGARAFHNGNILANVQNRRKLVASSSQICQT